MSKTRNQRRMQAKARLMAKTVRIANASEAARLDQVREVVAANKLQPSRRVISPKISSVYRGYTSPRAKGPGVTYS
jgi:hypothetical protein